MEPLAMEPLVIEPWYRPQVWGGRALERWLGRPLPGTEAIGEIWTLSGHEQAVSRVAEGPHAGQRLTELWAEQGAALRGSPDAAQPFPLLFKLLDASGLLSVQVHPSNAIARELRGEPFGKTEAWVILDCAPEGRIFAGLKPGVDRRVLERALGDGTVAECLHSFRPRPGDCIFLPAGTVHAVGGGVLMAEVQQSSDATYRLFDWNRQGTDGRPRPLHVAEALACIDWSAGPVAPVSPQMLERDRDDRSELLVDCRFFRLVRRQLSSACRKELSVDGCPSAMMVIAGRGVLVSDGGARYAATPGTTLLLPARRSAAAWEAGAAGLTVLEVTWPAESPPDAGTSTGP